MFRFSASSVCSLLLVAPALMAQGPASAARQTGTVTSVTGMTITVSTAAKAQIAVPVTADAAVLQLPPCGTSLKQATPSTFAAIATGDRVVLGKVGDTVTASRVILMKASDLAACHASQQADWQKNGTSGLVKAVDGPVLTIAVGAKAMKVDTTGTTVFRRYADDSVNFEDAKPGALTQIAAGDQVSVRGPKSDDGMTITAEEVVTGMFENLSGVLTAVDPAASTISFVDLATKKAVTVKVTTNSDLRKLPPQAAAMFASRTGGGGGAAGGAGTHPGGAGGSANGAAGPSRSAAGSAANTPASAGASGAVEGRTRSAGMDLSRMLGRLPTQTVADLHNGEAVMLVASNGHGPELTAITLLSGVDPLLSAASSNGQAITLSPWNIGGGDAGGGGAGGPQ